MQDWIAWIIASAVLFIMEMVTPTAFFFACLGLGAIVGAIVTTFADGWIVWGSFFISSVIFVLISRPFTKKMLKTPSRPANVDSLIGQKGVVIEDIDPLVSKGRVKVEGEEWVAKSTEKISKGEFVEILEVKGTHLIVKKM